MKLIFAGTPMFAVPTLEALVKAGHEVALVVTQPDRPAGRGGKLHASDVKRLAVERRLPVFQPEDVNSGESLALLREVGARAMVVVAFGQKLSEDVLKTAELGGFNLHGSLLPKYRGAAPVAWALIRGEKTTGVTVIRMAQAIDAGEMFARASVDVDPDWTEADLDAALSRLGASLMVKFLRELESGPAEPEPQDGAAATFARRLTKADGRIRWSKPARRIRNRIRGVTPWPGAFTFIETKRQHHPVRVSILKTSLLADAPETEEAAGTVRSVDRDGIVVATGKGLLRIDRMKPAGGREMRAEDFARGYGIEPGMRFTDALPPVEGEGQREGMPTHE